MKSTSKGDPLRQSRVRSLDLRSWGLPGQESGEQEVMSHVLQLEKQAITWREETSELWGEVGAGEPSVPGAPCGGQGGGLLYDLKGRG